MGNVALGKKMKRARKQFGLRQSDVAEEIGITANHYAKIERGESTSIDTLKKILKLLKIKSDVLGY